MLYNKIYILQNNQFVVDMHSPFINKISNYFFTFSFLGIREQNFFTIFIHAIKTIIDKAQVKKIYMNESATHTLSNRKSAIISFGQLFIFSKIKS